MFSACECDGFYGRAFWVESSRVRSRRPANASRGSTRAKIEPGQRALVYGASGSVGTFAVQLAKQLGAVVTGVGSTANLELVKSLGADEVIDYTTESFANHGAIYDVVLVAVDRGSFADCLKALRPHGIYLNVTTPVRTLAMCWAALTSGKAIVTGEHPPQNAEDLMFLKGLIEAGKLRAVIDRRLRWRFTVQCSIVWSRRSPNVRDVLHVESLSVELDSACAHDGLSRSVAARSARSEDEQLPDVDEGAEAGPRRPLRASARSAATS